jgi:hypothetical protein
VPEIRRKTTCKRPELAQNCLLTVLPTHVLGQFRELGMIFAPAPNL